MNQVKKTIKLLRRSPYQALAAALAMSLTFFVSSIFVILIFGGQLVLKDLQERPEVNVFFKDEANDSQISQTIEIVRNTGFSKEIKVISKEEALAIYRERFKNDPQLLESVTSDFLPRSIQIAVTKPEGIIEIKKAVESREEVDQVVSLSEQAAEGLSRTLNVLKIGGIVFIASLTAVSFLIIIMVVGMRIAIRRDEISIMSLVGATKWYIARPFFIEGAIYGIIGATLATTITYSLLLFYSPNIQKILSPIEVFPISPLFFVYLWAGEALVAAFVGIAGATIALFRYLKVR